MQKNIQVYDESIYIEAQEVDEKVKRKNRTNDRDKKNKKQGEM